MESVVSDNQGVEPAPPPPTDLNDPSLYINRELSWLEFNQRVLREAQDRELLARPSLA